MSARVVMYLLGNLCLLFINLIGHVLYNKHGDSNVGEKDTLCMFQYNSPYLKVHWSAMILPSVLLGLSPLVVMTTTLEFIAAQSPHFMKGLIIGLLFAIIGVFRMIGALALIPFSLKDIWSTTSMVQNPPITNCGFGYLLFTFVFASFGLVLFALVAKRYTYRVRDNDPYNQSQVEEIVSRYLERPDSYSYSSTS